jgi:hypothetical protein
MVVSFVGEKLGFFGDSRAPGTALEKLRLHRTAHGFHCEPSTLTPNCLSCPPFGFASLCNGSYLGGT